MREEIKLALPFEIKSLDEDGRIQGYGAVFNNVDFGLDRLEPGAFKKSLRKNKTLPMLWQHYSDEPIGVWDDLQEDKNGLMVAGDLNLSRQSGQADVPMAWKARALAKQGAVTGLSIGFFANEFRYEDDVRVLEQVDVVEVSMATFPMNPLAQVVDVKTLTNRAFVQMARERMGLSRQAAEALRSGGLKAMREYVGSRQSGNDDAGSRKTGDADIGRSLQHLADIIMR